MKLYFSLLSICLFITNLNAQGIKNYCLFSADSTEILLINRFDSNKENLIFLEGSLPTLIVFFAGIMIPIAVRAKSFKEAQSIISPLNIVIVLPAMVGFFPGIELNEITALIPVVNIVLATKELIAGTLEWNLVLMAFGVMVFLASTAVFFSYRKFESEGNVIS